MAVAASLSSRVQNFENVASDGDHPLVKFSTFRLEAVGAETRLQSRRLCCPCDAMSPVAAPRGRCRGRNLENFKKGRGPIILTVFAVVVPDMLGRRNFENLKNGAQYYLLILRVPTPAPRSCGRAPTANSIPSEGGGVTSQWERGRRLNRPAEGNALKPFTRR